MTQRLIESHEGGSPCAVGVPILQSSVGLPKPCFCQGMAVRPVALTRWRGRQWRWLECTHASAAGIPVVPASHHPPLAVEQITQPRVLRVLLLSG